MMLDKHNGVYEKIWGRASFPKAATLKYPELGLIAREASSQGAGRVGPF
jgi:hypothetical protein